jgi:hypothetical protein
MAAWEIRIYSMTHKKSQNTYREWAGKLNRAGGKQMFFPWTPLKTITSGLVFFPNETSLSSVHVAPSLCIMIMFYHSDACLFHRGLESQTLYGLLNYLSLLSFIFSFCILRLWFAVCNFRLCPLSLHHQNISDTWNIFHVSHLGESVTDF